MFTTRWIALQKYKKIIKSNKFPTHFSPQATSSVAQCAERIDAPQPPKMNHPRKARKDRRIKFSSRNFALTSEVCIFV